MIWARAPAPKGRFGSMLIAVLFRQGDRQAAAHAGNAFRRKKDAPDRRAPSWLSISLGETDPRQLEVQSIPPLFK